MTEPATTHAETATTQAETATTQAETATTQAETATTQAETAGTQAAGAAPAGPSAAAGPQDEDILEALRDVVDPELGINVVDLGLIYGVNLGEDRVATIDMTLTSAACPLTDVIEEQAATALDGLVADFRINWVWIPPWGPDKITEEGREQLRALGFNV